ncbi:MAG: FAD-binding protein [Firmicutes bacterium]|nr:FAD-binding protein [Bacillota bacterium]
MFKKLTFIITASVLLFTLIFFLPGCNFSRQEPIYSPEVPLSFDVVVWGSGTAAVAAALEADDNGAQVLLLPEKLPLLYDLDLSWKEGLLLADPEEMKPKGEAEASEVAEEREDEHLVPALKKMLLQQGAGLNNPVLLQVFLDELWQVEEWFSRWDELFLQQVEAGHPLHPYLYYLDGPLEENALKKEILSQLQRRPIKIETGFQIKEIMLDQHKGVESIVVSREAEEDREEKEIFTQAFIIATGGFGGSSSLLQKFAPQPLAHFSLSDSRGEYLSLAQSLQLELVQASFLHYHLLQENSTRESFHAGFLPKNGLFLKKDPYGEYSFFTFADYWQQSFNNRSFWQAGELYYLFHLTDTKTHLEKNLLIKPELLPTAGDLQEKGFEPALVREISRLLSPPYGFISLRAGVKYTLGGLPIDAKGQVQKDGEIVPGLFAAGEAAGGLHGQAALQGAVLSENIVFGLIAGREAAAWSRR